MAPLIQWTLTWQTLGQTPRDGKDQGGLKCFSPWVRKGSDMSW